MDTQRPVPETLPGKRFHFKYNLPDMYFELADTLII
jgi:hypothetical protein